MHHIREGKHGARSPQQAIAIGLSKARRAGVKLAPPKKGSTSEQTREQAKRDTQKGRRAHKGRPSRTRSRATSAALQREGDSVASQASLSRHAHTAAQKRGRSARHRSAMSAVKTKGTAEFAQGGAQSGAYA
jgi:hypothetical protein